MMQGQKEKLQGETNHKVGLLCVDHIISEKINIKETLTKEYPQAHTSGLKRASL